MESIILNRLTSVLGNSSLEWLAAAVDVEGFGDSLGAFTQPSSH
jgi:hypothetical protein